MAVKIVHAEANSVAQDVQLQMGSVEDAIAVKVDQYADLESKIKKIQVKLDPLLEQLDALKKEFQEYANAAAPADESIDLAGSNGVYRMGPRANKSSVADKAKLIEIIGQDKFNELADMKLADVRAYLIPEELAAVLSEERVGNRIGKYKAGVKG